MEIIRSRVPNKATVERTGPFTGTAWADHLLDTDGVAMRTVYFAPGARTFWHHHERGQLLTITSDEGLAVSRDGTVARVRAGDMVWTRPGEEHWPRACQDSLMAHHVARRGLATGLHECQRGQDYRPGERLMTERRYIVTGAASGIGRAVAQHAAAEGAALSLVDISADALEDLAATLSLSFKLWDVWG